MLMETLSDYGALSYFGVQTFTTAIYNTWLNMGDRASAALLSVALLAVMLGLIVAEGRARGRAQFYTQSGKGQAPLRRPLKAWQGWVVLLLCVMPVVLGLLAFNRYMRQALEQVGLKPDGFAGHSVGEWSAMLASGMMSRAIIAVPSPSWMPRNSAA